MRKAKTHFQQVPVSIAKQAAAANEKQVTSESSNAAEDTEIQPLRPPPKSVSKAQSNGRTLLKTPKA